jgi:lipopolysaccharide/colanic/teichoic acid biosynthesis glycosyltransferase
MVVDADSSGVDSTSNNDLRITPIGSIIRKYKIDEIPQLIHVILGDMSLVGPRPNVMSDVRIYTDKEKKLLDIRPGITDFSSIVFSDEGDILQDASDPDLRYNQIIRPWKSRLGILYIEKNSFFLDVKLIVLTICSIFNRNYALEIVSNTLKNLGAEEKLINISKRDSELEAYPPPGSDKVVIKRD